ncbi:nucleotide pyrophosphohydrolase [Oscillatoriales cyanobacterium USR001]|nr:nucleotide pyrophosphohydrolase [Oscillatoriales cyanobacterium USR001]
MRKEYYKLVRDRIPEIITKNGLNYEIVTLNETEYRQALRQKLIEEAGETAEANEQNLVTELADLYEVIDAVMMSYGITRELVILEQVKRREDRGGFEERIMLLWTE